jgi:hypothetical protein
MGGSGRERWVVSLLVLAAVVGVTQCSFHHDYRATATLIILAPPGSVSGVELIPNAPTSPPPISDVLTRAVDQPDVARAVVAAGGSTHFNVHAGSDARIDIAVTSTRRDQATKTVNVLVGLLRRKLVYVQTSIGAPAAQRSTIAEVTFKPA